MGTAARNLVGSVDVEDLVAQLNLLHNANVATMYWSHAVQNRLAGQALQLRVGDELNEVVELSLGDARRIADRIAELGGAVTADLGDIIEQSPFDAYALPDNTSDVTSILEYALQQTRTVIQAYADVLDMVRGRDDLTYRLVADLLGHVVHREDELEAVLDG